ncbi:MAG: GNAT family N-acetyltransferase [Candidatus Hydrogenedentes bacterium]|nr:GNAT family N-acetyltransferase [Candidatus Hydrogenedentota bacterium]
MVPYEIREAVEDDLPFIRAMLYEATHWRESEAPQEGEPPDVDAGLAHPDLAKLLESWPRQGDFGAIAAAEDGTPLGAAWFRYWTDENHSYGYVASDVPELAIGVIKPYRHVGIGRALLHTLQGAALALEIPRLSLSVEKDNPALLLYQSEGFATVGTLGNAYTMVWHAV